MLVFKAFSFAAFLIAGCLLIQTCQQDKHRTDIQKESGPTTGEQSLFRFDNINRTASQPIDPDMPAPGKFKFLEIEVINVVNPDKVHVQFEVIYQVDKDDQIFLGTFGLFPPDNPGRFIVSTQGKLQSRGELVLSLVSPNEAPSDSTLKITVKRIQFRER